MNGFPVNKTIRANHTAVKTGKSKRTPGKSMRTPGKSMRTQIHVSGPAQYFYEASMKSLLKPTAKL
jgi:hypothetical protein